MSSTLPWQQTNSVALAEQCYASAFQALDSADLTKARALFALLALLEPRQERSWVGLGVAHERAGKLAAAAMLYALGEHAVSEPSAWLAFGRGRTLQLLGREFEANQAFDSAEANAEPPLRQTMLEQR